MGKVSKILLREEFDHGIAGQPRWAKFRLWPATELCRAAALKDLFGGGHYGTAKALLRNLKLNGFHELRAAYACDRYEQMTGHLAPVNGGVCFRVDRQLERAARQQLSIELDHLRIDVISAYIGGKT